MSEFSRAEVCTVAVAEAFLHRVGATAAAVDRAVTGKGAGRFGDPELDVARLVDAGANEFVISNPKSGATELQQDLRSLACVTSHRGGPSGDAPHGAGSGPAQLSPGRREGDPARIRSWLGPDPHAR